MLLNQLETATNYIIEQNTNDIRFYRKSIIFSGLWRRSKTSDIASIFWYLLERRTVKVYNGIDKSAWHDFTQQLGEDQQFLGAMLVAARKAMVSNMRLLPTIITEQKSLDRLGLPLHYSMHDLPKNDDLLEYIVYIGKKNQTSNMQTNSHN